MLTQFVVERTNSFSLGSHGSLHLTVTSTLLGPLRGGRSEPRPSSGSDRIEERDSGERHCDWGELRIIAPANRDLVACSVHDDGFPPAQYKAFLSENEMAWLDPVPDRRPVGDGWGISPLAGFAS